jgi:glutamine amidotransferase
MTTVIVDYNSGNLRSAEKSFQRMATDVGSGEVIVSSDPDVVRRGDRIVLPGVGAFGDCRHNLGGIGGLFGPGFDWIKGDVVKLEPEDKTLKIPHMGWNELQIRTDHPVFEGIVSGDHAYFVHSYHLMPKNPDHLLATVDYGGPITAAVGRDNMVGTQFHPEKSQKTGLRLIANFLRWAP